jgi:2-iminoacetate synthase ThiH
LTSERIIAAIKRAGFRAAERDNFYKLIKYH